jgi:Integrase zinc binding domain/RNase H-like domain found in reverse transcriptase
MKEGFEPKSSKNYNLTPAEQIELDKFLKENLKKGYIRPSQSPMASPFFFVSKKDGKLWPCQDYRYLNNWMVKNSYPLPLISEIMDKLKGAKYFTKLDVHWGYNNVQIRKGDKWKGAFKMNKGLFKLTVMFFGMCNSPATFKEWRHYIQGSGHTTIVYSNHKNLTYFWTAQELNDWQAKWSLYLSGFNLKLIHLPGTKMVQSDALSRRPDYGTDKWMEEEDKVVLPDNLFINLLDTELQEQILNGKELDLDVKNTIETLMEEGPTNLKNNLQDWKIEEIDGRKTIFFKGKNYIPKNLELQRDIVKMYHNHETAGHSGDLETYNKIRQNYWWHGLQTFVKNYIQGCGICQQFCYEQYVSSFLL